MTINTIADNVYSKRTFVLLLCVCGGGGRGYWYHALVLMLVFLTFCIHGVSQHYLQCPDFIHLSIHCQCI